MPNDQSTDPPTSSNNRVRQVEAIVNGTVIDHIPGAMTLKVANLLAGEHDQVSIGMNLRSARLGRKGVVKISGRELDERTLSRLALIAPSATVSIIRDYQVVHKSTVPMPQLFEDIARCANPNCVTNHEKWSSRLEVIAQEPLRVRCVYCERGIDATDLTLM
jgi:aspartate carbamoyltransferase regulatory subunit